MEIIIIFYKHFQLLNHQIFVSFLELFPKNSFLKFSKFFFNSLKLSFSLSINSEISSHTFLTFFFNSTIFFLYLFLLYYMDHLLFLILYVFLIFLIILLYSELIQQFLSIKNPYLLYFLINQIIFFAFFFCCIFWFIYNSIFNSIHRVFNAFYIFQFKFL